MVKLNKISNYFEATKDEIITINYWKPIFIRFCEKYNYITIHFPDYQKEIMNEFSENVEVLEKKREG